MRFVHVYNDELRYLYEHRAMLDDFFVNIFIINRYLSIVNEQFSFIYLMLTNNLPSKNLLKPFNWSFVNYFVVLIHYRIWIAKEIIWLIQMW